MTRARRARTICAAAGAASALGVGAFANGFSPGQVDPTFGTNGSVSTAVGSSIRAATTIRQPDGKIVVAGGSQSGLSDATLVRYLPSGGLDTSFGNRGVSVADFGRGETIVGLALQGDGKIVAAVGHAGGLDLVRYLSDGRVDTTFGTNGVARTAIDGNGGGGSAGLVVQPDGRIVAAATRGGSGINVVRHTATGSPDPTFGANGGATAPFGPSAGGSYGIVLQAEGIVVKANTGLGIEVVRLTPSGAADASFGSGGVTRIFGRTSTGLLSQPDGKIVMTGMSTCGSECDILLVRLLPSGELDRGFGIAGIVKTDLGRQDVAYGVALQSDGKLVVAGRTAPAFPGNGDFVVLRYTSAGDLDGGFADNGVATTDLGADETATGVVVEPGDGTKIFAAGEGFASSPAPPTRFVLVRYFGDDTVPPETTVVAATPSSALTRARDASFTFTGSDDKDPTPLFECSLDRAAFVDCTSPAAYAGLADGPHAFAVRARDVARNVDASPALREWTVDSTPPVAAPSRSPSANGAGWNRGAVTVSWNWQDRGSGLGANCASATRSTQEGVSVPVTGACSDVAGNTATETVMVKVDSVPPRVRFIGVTRLSKTRALVVRVSDRTSGLHKTDVHVDGRRVRTAGAAEAISYRPTGGWIPGRHAVVVTAFDRAGNQQRARRAFDVR